MSDKMKHAEIILYFDSQIRINQISLASHELWQHDHAQKVAGKNPDLRYFGVDLFVLEYKVVFAHHQVIMVLFEP